MTRLGLGPAARFLPLVVDSALLIGLALGAFGPNGAAALSHLDDAVFPHPEVNVSQVDLTVDPPSYWLQTGSNVTLRAVWSVLSPLCRAVPLWYSWSVGGSNASGFLNATNGPSATFVAASFAFGTSVVHVRSDALLDCGTSDEVVDRASAANISVMVPLSLRGVGVTPDPLTPGEEATLQGIVEGGEPPYTLDVTWGDDSHSVVALSGPGAFSLNHSFVAGEFTPSVLVSDSAGNLVNDSVDEGASVGEGLEVGILTSAPVAQVGVAVDFVGVVSGPSEGSVPLFDCSNASVGEGVSVPGNPNGTDFSCTFASTGTAVVLFGVYSTNPGDPSASAVLDESVVAAPHLSVEPVAPISEVGSVTFARVDLSGGVLPIALSWNLSGDRSAGTELIESDGEGVFAFAAGSAGTFGIGVRATDALGSWATNGTAIIQVDPDLQANATGLSMLDSPYVLAAVDGAALSGCPPFEWWVLPEYLPTNHSNENGTLGDAGEFTWNGSYAREGNLSITVDVNDGCGANWQDNLQVPLAPPLRARASAGPGPSSSNETLEVNLSIQGGAPPFRVDVNASDGESWNRTAPVDGVYDWLLATDGNGTLQVTLAVEDDLGTGAEFNFTVTLARPITPSDPPPTRSPPSSTVPQPVGNSTVGPTLGVVGLLAPVGLSAGVAGAFLLLRRRRNRRERAVSPAPDPVAVLRRIIEPADGAERFTVELLAEEAGLSLEQIRSTINRLVSEGKIHSENGADGEEVLSWSHGSGG